MDIAETFAQNETIKNAFGANLQKINNIQMTKAVAKATPLDEISQALGITVVEYTSETQDMSGYNDKTIFINKFDTPFRKRYDTALLIGKVMQPNASLSAHLKFATDLLLPEASIRLAVSEYTDEIGTTVLDYHQFEKMLKALSYIFEVNPHALDIRLHQVLGTDLHY